MIHLRKVQDKQGHSVELTEYFYGYKAHVSTYAESELSAGMEVTGRGAYDRHHFTGLVNQDLEQGLPVEAYAADNWRGFSILNHSDGQICF